ncbi:hypothetical protein [Staphylococcus hyicus]|uniref:hypothetical protein n=1 Tax=Staphylococcus hyicus TaxID=1284 RepID=UPI003132E4D2
MITNTKKSEIGFNSSVNDLIKKVNNIKKSINKEIKNLRKEKQSTNIEEKKVKLEERIKKYNDRNKDICKMQEYINKINKIRNSKDFKDTKRIRNDIVHNSPPLTLENPVVHRKVRYMNSDTVKNHIDIFLEQYLEILTILKEMFEYCDWIKEYQF